MNDFVSVDRDDLADTVRDLHDEVQALRESVDELRESIVWELRQLLQANQDRLPPWRVTSLPVDPALEDFHHRVNRVGSTPPAMLQDELTSWAEHLMQGEPSDWRQAQDWREGEEFSPDAIVQLDPSIYDWFVEYLVTIWESVNWRVLDGDEDLQYLVWANATGRFLRRLTARQLGDFLELAKKLRPIELTRDSDVEAASAGRRQQTMF